MKRAAIAVLVLVGCQRAAPPQPANNVVHVTTSNAPSDERRVKERDLIRPGAKFFDSAKLGGKLGADGRVEEEVHSYVEGQPIYLTLNLRESPVGLQTRAVWYDDGGKEIAQEVRPMNGAKTVTFAMTKKLAPGFYRVNGFWGGNFAAEKTFQVIKR